MPDDTLTGEEREPATAATEVDRLTRAPEALLDYEQQELIPLLDGS
ncbi:hypothetical protein [Streptomyces griseoviridis]